MSRPVYEILRCASRKARNAPQGVVVSHREDCGFTFHTGKQLARFGVPQLQRVVAGAREHLHAFRARSWRRTVAVARAAGIMIVRTGTFAASMGNGAIVPCGSSGRDKETTRCHRALCHTQHRVRRLFHPCPCRDPCASRRRCLESSSRPSRSST